MLRGVLFDFDGTLADSFDAIAESVNFVRTENHLPELRFEEIKSHVGHGLEHLMEKMLPGCDVGQAKKAYHAHHKIHMKTHTRLYPNAREFLSKLQLFGISMGVCSNKPVGFTTELIEHLGISSFFKVVLGPEDVPNPKPAPDMLIEAAKRLKIKHNEVVYVGDMDVDIKASGAAGMEVWIVRHDDSSFKISEEIASENIHISFLEIEKRKSSLFVAHSGK
jgi:phosphoglycolate phosphatase